MAVVGVSLVHVMVWCGPVRFVGWLARLCWGAVVMELVGLAVVLVHWETRIGGGGGVLLLLVVPRFLAL